MFQHIGGERCRLDCVDVKHLSPKVRPAGDLSDAIGIVELVKGGRYFCFPAFDAVALSTNSEVRTSKLTMKRLHGI